MDHPDHSLSTGGLAFVEYSKKSDSPPHTVEDPVCGMTIDPDTSKHRSKHGGESYFFCSAGCKTKFDAAPERYLKPEPASSQPVPEGTIYTCPMHPQIRQVGPGACPICGMALEPLLVGAEPSPTKN